MLNLFNKTHQIIYDWYICVPREFYRKYIYKFWQRQKNFVPITDEHGYVNYPDPLPLGYSTLDDKLKEATHRRVDRSLLKKFRENKV